MEREGKLAKLTLFSFGRDDADIGLVHFANFLNPMNSTIFVLFGKYCPIMDQLGSKDSSRDFQLNCVISYFFTYI
jgi:hypothetical protein